MQDIPVVQGHMMERGYVKLWRKMLDNNLLQHPTALQVYCYLLLHATHKPYRKIVGGVVFDLCAGDVIVGRKRLAEDLKISEQQARTAIKILEKLEILTIRSTNKCSVVSLINWGTYQSVTNGYQPAEQPTSNQQPTSSQPAPNQHLTTRQEQRTKNKEEEESTSPPAPQRGEALPDEDPTDEQVTGEADGNVETPDKSEGKSEKKRKKKNSSCGIGDTVPELQAAIRDFSPDEALQQALEAWRITRAKVGKPLTGYALYLSFRLLQRLAPDNPVQQTEIVLQSVQRSWAGLFPLKDDFSSGRQGTGGNYQPASQLPEGW